jgi:hypothetical protein
VAVVIFCICVLVVSVFVCFFSLTICLKNLVKNPYNYGFIYVIPGYRVVVGGGELCDLPGQQCARDKKIKALN